MLPIAQTPYHLEPGASQNNAFTLHLRPEPPKKKPKQISGHARKKLAEARKAAQE